MFIGEEIIYLSCPKGVTTSAIKRKRIGLLRNKTQNTFKNQELKFKVNTEEEAFLKFFMIDILDIPSPVDPFERAEQFHGRSGNPIPEIEFVLQSGVF